MRVVFATHFDSTYILQGVSLINSIINIYPEYKIYVSLLDNLSEKIVKEHYRHISNVIFDNGLIRKVFEKKLKNNGKLSETIFALKPLLIRATMERIEAEKYFYCDADLYFFNRYRLDVGAEDIFLTEHLFRNSLEDHLVYGKFNGGFIGFSKTPDAVRCLEWWAERCEESTQNNPKKGIVGDQKYLESFPSIVKTFRSVKSVSLNQSVWTFDDSSIVQVGPIINGVLVDCYHFHRTKIFKRIIKTGINQYGKFRTRREVFEHIYKPYLEELAINREILGLSIKSKQRFTLSDIKKFEWTWR